LEKKFEVLQVIYYKTEFQFKTVNELLIFERGLYTQIIFSGKLFAVFFRLRQAYIGGISVNFYCADKVTPFYERFYFYINYRSRIIVD